MPPPPPWPHAFQDSNARKRKAEEQWAWGDDARAPDTWDDGSWPDDSSNWDGQQSEWNRWDDKSKWEENSSEGSEDEDDGGASQHGGQQPWQQRYDQRRWEPRQGLQRNNNRNNLAPSRWFCQVCNKDLKRQDRYEKHVEEDHVKCPEPDCKFSGPEHVLAVHKLKHVKAADGMNVTDSPEEVNAWINMRKHSFPSKGNVKKKAEHEEKRRQSGALPDEPPKVSMLEKLLRGTHGLERGTKGFGYGYGSYGKGKGKKGGKGKDFKGGKGGKDGKGKGKGKKGKGKGKKGSSWFGPDVVEAFEEAPEEHPTVALPLPSVVANCVPLEAPFAAAAFLAARGGAGSKRGPCRFFERGFCYHGQNCQYEHGVAASGNNAGAQAIGNTAWWVLPSTLANRAGRPGEGPAGGVFGPVARSRGRLRATHVAPYVPPDSRERRDGLLRRLLRGDVDQYYSAILQCVRYIVNTDFLRLERPVAPIEADDSYAASGQSASLPSTAPPAVGSNLDKVVEPSKVAEAARSSPSSSLVVVNPIDAALLEEAEREELDDTDIAELAEVLS